MKRRLITLRRIYIAGSKNFIRNSWLTIAATAVMVVALVNMLTAVVLNVTTKNAVSELSTNLKVSVYLNDDFKEARAAQLKQAFENDQYVKEVNYVTKEKAQDQFMESFKEDPKLLEGLALIGSDSLPASIEVGVSDLSKMEEVGNIAKDKQYEDLVNSVSLGKTEVKETINRAATVQKFITISTLTTALVFAIVSILIIFNTIRMAIFTRSDEIRTQKLLGATSYFIRGPFLVESSLYGVLAGVISASVVVGGIYFLGDKISSTEELGLTDTYNMFTKQPITIAMMYIGSITAGVIIGITSSYLALKRYLKIRNW